MTRLLPALLLTAAFTAGGATSANATNIVGAVSQLTPTVVDGRTVPAGGDYESYRPRLNGTHTSAPGVYGVETEARQQRPQR